MEIIQTQDPLKDGAASNMDKDRSFNHLPERNYSKDRQKLTSSENMRTVFNASMPRIEEAE